MAPDHGSSNSNPSGAVSSSSFQTEQGQTIRTFQLRNANGTILSLSEWGACILDIQTRDRAGQCASVVLGYTSNDAWIKNEDYLGATIGPYANRIDGASFELDGRSYALLANAGPHCLHGGKNGFSHQVWRGRIDADGSVVFQLDAPHGRDGFPGPLHCQLRYTLSPEDQIIIETEATPERDTILNITNHSYFHLDNSPQVGHHQLRIDAEQCLEFRQDFLPTGRILNTQHHDLDFRQERELASVKNWQNLNEAFLFKATRNIDEPVASLYSPQSGRYMEVFTTEPSLMLYTGAYLTSAELGQHGRLIQANAGLCLETQHPPDAIHHPHFPNTVIRQGECFKSQTIYRFSTRTM